MADETMPVSNTSEPFRSLKDEGMDKYGVEDRRKLIEAELKQVQDRLAEKTASEVESKYLVQREQDLKEILNQLK